MVQQVERSPYRPAFKWPGGKTRHAPIILPMMVPHETYAEAFAGSLAILLAKPPSRYEVVNDISGDIVGFYRVVKFHLDALLEEMRYVLNSRQEFFDAVKQPGLTDVQRAARFILRQKLSYGADGHSFGMLGARSSRRRQMALIENLHERLDSVVIENLDWKRFVANYDRPNTFFFFDPPYVVCKIGAYRGWKPDEMAEFAKRLETIQGAFLVTVDDSPICRRLFAKFRCKKIQMRNRIPNMRVSGPQKFGELIVTPHDLKQRGRSLPSSIGEEVSFSA